MTLEAAAKGEIQRPSERRAALEAQQGGQVKKLLSRESFDSSNAHPAAGPANVPARSAVTLWSAFVALGRWLADAANFHHHECTGHCRAWARTVPDTAGAATAVAVAMAAAAAAEAEATSRAGASRTATAVAAAMAAAAAVAVAGEEPSLDVRLHLFMARQNRFIQRRCCIVHIWAGIAWCAAIKTMEAMEAGAAAAEGATSITVAIRTALSRVAMAEEAISRPATQGAGMMTSAGVALRSSDCSKRGGAALVHLLPRTAC